MVTLIIWQTDLDTAFDVTIFGIGTNQAGVQMPANPIVSPSGNWALNASDTAALQGQQIFINHGSTRVDYKPDPDLRFVFPAYSDAFNLADGVAKDGAIFDPVTSGPKTAGWAANQRMIVVADTSDASQWKWMVAYSGRKS